MFKFYLYYQIVVSNSTLFILLLDIYCMLSTSLNEYIYLFKTYPDKLIAEILNYYNIKFKFL